MKKNRTVLVIIISISMAILMTLNLFIFVSLTISKLFEFDFISNFNLFYLQISYFHPTCFSRGSILKRECFLTHFYFYNSISEILIFVIFPFNSLLANLFKNILEEFYFYEQ